MQIEKINENKFKCTLEKRDLDIRNIRLEELAYGTEKARQLFDEMMTKAHDQFGFTHENAAISVEAYPISRDYLVLVVSKVTNFDEVDTRFSRFSEKDETPVENSDKLEEGLEDMGHGIALQEPEGRDVEVQKDESLPETLEEGKKAQDMVEEKATSGAGQSTENESSDQIRVFTFHSLDILIEAARILHHQYNGVNSLYKDEDSATFYLVLRQTFHTDEEFSKACNLLSEYGTRLSNPQARFAYCKEHYHCMVSQTALQRLYLF